MDINKKLIGDIAEHIVSVSALNDNVLINKYKITRTKLEAIIAILIEVELVEYKSTSNSYVVNLQDKEQLMATIRQTHEIIDRKTLEQNEKRKVKQGAATIKTLREVIDKLNNIDSRLTNIEHKLTNNE